MTLRADHVAGAAFVVFGVVIFALSGDLPFGRLSMPGAGFMPKLMAGADDAVRRAWCCGAAKAQAFAEIDWSDLASRARSSCIAAAASRSTRALGFLLTMIAPVRALLVVVERRNLLRAAIYSARLTSSVAYRLFDIASETPLPNGPLGF